MNENPNATSMEEVPLRILLRQHRLGLRLAHAPSAAARRRPRPVREGRARGPSVPVVSPHRPGPAHPTPAVTPTSLRPSQLDPGRGIFFFFKQKTAYEM